MQKSTLKICSSLSTASKRYNSYSFAGMKRLLPEPVINLQLLINNLEDIKRNLVLRRETGYNDIINKLENLVGSENVANEKEISRLGLQLPNNFDPAIEGYNDDYKIVSTVGNKRQFTFNPKLGTDILIEKDLLKMDQLKEFCGERSYYFCGHLAKLELALVEYTIQQLLNKGFQLVSVPEILEEEVIERCGMPTKGARTQVYKLDANVHGPGWCLSGTSEMALAALLTNADIPKEKLPMRLAASSHCYRAEISDLSSEKGLYRVHQFTKVEMFGVCLPEQSDDMLASLLEIQQELFSSFDLHYRVIDMAPQELGNQAYRKFDIEAWMPGLNKYGEISSASNCTDYQSRRLNIRSGNILLHTVNGTACAVPRVIIAITETHQTEQGRIPLPSCLHSYTGYEILGMKRGPRQSFKEYIPRELAKYYVV